MAHEYYLSVERRKTKAIIRVAARHNTREEYIASGVSERSNINPARIADNITLRGSKTADGVVRMAQLLMDEAKVNVNKLRKDAVTMLEVLFSLPKNTAIDPRQYFEACTAWAEQNFNAPVLSSVVHLDEGAPHCHVLILPLIGGRMVGSDLYGSRTKLDARQDEFYQKVAKPFGLPRQAPQKRYSAAVRTDAMELAFASLEANSGLTDDVVRFLIDPFKRNPEPLLQKLGLTMPQPKVAKDLFVKMMTKSCKPEAKEKPYGFAKAKPYGFNDSPDAAIEQTRTRDGFQISPTLFPPPVKPPTVTTNKLETNTPAPTSASTGGEMMSTTTTTEQTDHGSQAVPADSAPRYAEAQETPASAASTVRSSHGTFQDTPVPPPINTEGGYLRERDRDQRAEYWDEQQGEFVKPTVKAFRGAV